MSFPHEDPPPAGSRNGEAITGEPICGSWWAHARGGEIFAALEAIADSDGVRCFRLVNGKLTFVHRRLWPALVRLADELGCERLTAIVQEHTPSGAHKNIKTPFARWVTPDLEQLACRLSAEEARARLGEWYTGQRRPDPLMTVDGGHSK